MNRSLHMNADLQSRLDATLRRWQDDWRALDMIPLTSLSPHEQVHLSMVKDSIEKAGQQLRAMFVENQGKRTTDYQ